MPIQIPLFQPNLPAPLPTLKADISPLESCIYIYIQILLTVVLECLPELLNAQQQLIPTWYIHFISHCCFSANFISPTPQYKVISLPRSIFGQNLLNFNQFSLLFLTLRVSNILVLKNYSADVTMSIHYTTQHRFQGHFFQIQLYICIQL